VSITSEHSHSDGQAPTQDALKIQECEVVGSSKGKSPWHPSLDISAYNKSFFLLEDDNARLKICDGDRLRPDAESLLGQATTLVCLANIKVEERKKTEGKKTQQIVEL